MITQNQPRMIRTRARATRASRIRLGASSQLSTLQRSAQVANTTGAIKPCG